MSFVAQLAGFAAVLRAAGIGVGIDAAVCALRALEAVGPDRRDDVRTALRATLVARPEQREVFDELFDRFFRLRVTARAPGPRAAPSRVAGAAASGATAVRPPTQARIGGSSGEGSAPPSPMRDAAGSASGAEQLRRADFAALAPDRLAEIARHVARLRLLLRPVATRRRTPDPRGRRIDLRATLRACVRDGGLPARLRRRAPRRRPPPLIVLCDVSGSMRRYSEVLLGFIHAVSRDLDTVHAFVFGTRLTDITRSLAERTPAAALAHITEAVEDYAGGTRIGACLGEFNRRHARRLPADRATVLLITDGLERGDPTILATEAARLQRGCRRLVWLNPLLRHDGFEPLAAGIRALLPRADEFLPAHNLASLEHLAAILADVPSPRRRQGH
jgi:uncharacterized protein with von Willebrand factor type A (vWA) domain